MRVVVLVWEGRWAGIPVITNVVKPQAIWPSHLKVEVGLHQYVDCKLREVMPRIIRYEQDRPEDLPFNTILVPGV